MWTIENFEPFQNKETVGTATAVCNAGQAGEFRFTGSVNLDIEATITEFINQAIAAKNSSNQDVSAQLIAIESQLNGVTA